jgi:uncharacterized alkaline shock family protein YloU
LEPSKLIRIEKIASREDIEAAIHHRKNRRQHVIPLPVVEVKQAYPKLMAHAIKVWFDQMVHRKHYDKTVVTPGYHRKGEVTISESALAQMILYCLREKLPTPELKRVRIKHQPEGFEIKVEIALPYGVNLAHQCEELREYTIRKIEAYAGITISRLDLHIASVQEGSSHKN